MASTLIAVDNLLQRALLTVSSADTVYAAANLCDNDGSAPWRVNAIAADEYISADMDEAGSDGVRDGGFEAASLTAGGWTGATNGASNTAVVDAAQHNTGSQSCKLTLATAGAGNYAKATKVFANIPSGERRTVQAALLGDGTVYARARVFCPETGQYLKSDCTWDTAGAAAADFATRATGTWATTTLQFTMPTYAASRMRTLSLWLIAIASESTNTGAAWVDDFRTWPSTSLVAIHGHNCGPVTCSWLASSTGAFAGEETTVATVSIYENRFYSYSSTPSDLRYQRLEFTGTNHEKLWVGEACMAQAAALGMRCEPALDWTATIAQTRSGRWVANLEQVPRESPTWSIHWRSDADREADTRELLRALGGARPSWFVPSSGEKHVVFGRLPAELPWSRSYDWIKSGRIALESEPYPVWVG